MKADVSIIVVSYNKTRQMIRECFFSIQSQTIQPREIIFVDDCSPRPFPQKDALSILLPQRSGVAFARDVGVRMAKGKLLLFLDADDMLAPDFLQHTLYGIQTHDIAYTNHVLFGDVEQNRLVEAPEFLLPIHIFPSKDTQEITLKLTVSCLMHRRVYETLHGFSSDLPVYEDWDFWIRAMVNKFTFCKTPSFLWYRQTKHSRNKQSLSFRADVFRQIIAPYELREGVLCQKQNE